MGIAVFVPGPFASGKTVRQDPRIARIYSKEGTTHGRDSQEIRHSRRSRDRRPRRRPSLARSAHPRQVRPSLPAHLLPPRPLPLRRSPVGAPHRRHHRRRRQDHLRAEGRRGPRRLVDDRHQHRRQQVPPRPDRHPRARVRRPRPRHPRRRNHPRLGPVAAATSPPPKTPPSSTTSSPTCSSPRRSPSTRPSGSTSAATASSPTPTPRTGTGTSTPAPSSSPSPATASPQCSACFINSVEDSLDSILTLAKTEGMLFKWGSGTGTNLSTIRGSMETLSGGGTASGPLSFMRGFDAFAGVIKSGGKTRRAAKMVILNVDHPDIVDFIECKAKEEAKAWALMRDGYDGSSAPTPKPTPPSSSRTPTTPSASPTSSCAPSKKTPTSPPAPSKTARRSRPTRPATS